MPNFFFDQRERRFFVDDVEVSGCGFTCDSHVLGERVLRQTGSDQVEVAVHQGRPFTAIPQRSVDVLEEVAGVRTYRSTLLRGKQGVVLTHEGGVGQSRRQEGVVLIVHS